MHFLPDVYVQCEACKGRRYNRETLEVLYQGRSVADILDLTVAEALSVLEAHPRLNRLLRRSCDVGLGYLRLGPEREHALGRRGPAGEAGTRAGPPRDGHTLYLLDEPTTGLHFDDIRKLLHVLGRLVEAGNTVVVIEHNLDVIKTRRPRGRPRPEAGEAEGGSWRRARPRRWRASPEEPHGAATCVRCWAEADAPDGVASHIVASVATRVTGGRTIKRKVICFN